jgi:amino acid transporter
VTTLISVPERSAAVGLVLILACISCWGVRESVALAAIITTLEVGTLIVVVVFGLPEVDVAALPDAFNPFADGALGPVLAGAGIAFFAFIGFEDIANMAEETLDPRRTAPRAIAWTLGLTMIAYLTLALVAISLPARAEIVESSAPVATIFEAVSSLDPAPVATVASLAMINGILAQLIMASRVLYGMASDAQLPSKLGVVSATRRTPVRATLLVSALIVVLTIAFPLLQLARVTSIITLTVFTMVNGSLVRLAYESPDGPLWSWRFNGMAGSLTAASLGIWQVVDLFR